MIFDNFDITLDDPIPISLDLDNDGIFETLAQEFDIDGDGIADTWQLSTDLDGDEIPDQTSIIHGIDTDGDGFLDETAYFQDTDLDGIPDTPYDTQDVSYDNGMIGDPVDDMEHWHQQTYQDTCAIASQEFILDDLTGLDFSEDQLRQEAIDNGWYTAGGGTPLDCIGNLLESHGIPIEKEYGCTLEDLSDKLAQGEKVIVAIDADEIWYPDQPDQDDILANAFGMPGQGVNHAVQVIGIDNSNPDNPMVILNDPGCPNGQGTMIPAAQFVNAWEDSNNYMVSTTG
ncbi:conserved hypothetical protein [Gloeothece citriformis PCC 7424]|uniref:Peptidase C39-like domain-containing protein n=1 Tax=Gloeothece citriformis (strain PCC 7424) TaxID=65393 RepID=B7KJ06_GLOC7|nr:hypothetical protein [Gloeothece citriformis]ACK70842.1 conserved hypothetical protein [Gloeothece citriformis PCC 7424]